MRLVIALKSAFKKVPPAYKKCFLLKKEFFQVKSFSLKSTQDGRRLSGNLPERERPRGRLPEVGPEHRDQHPEDSAEW